MPTLSLCMIVKNEEKFLEQCLLSVRELVDEIIIVDTGSTDRTLEIARQFTDKIYDFVWCDDFAAARNESLKHAKMDWILILDADETLSKQDHEPLRNLISSAAATVSGFILIQRNYFKSREDLSYGSFSGLKVQEAGDKQGFISRVEDPYLESKRAAGWLPTPIVRLFRNEMNIAFSGRVHEDITPSLLGGVVESSIPIHHYGKLNLENWKRKWSFYEQLGEKKAEEEDDYYAYFELGRQYLEGGNGDSTALLRAKEMFEKSIRLNEKFWLSWFNLGSVHLLQRNLNDAVSCLLNALEYNPDVPQIYLNLGVAYVQLKKYAEAVKTFWKGIERHPQRADLYKNLGLCYLEMGSQREATIVLKRAVELNPEYAKEFTFS